MAADISIFESKTGIKFHDTNLLKQAFIHRSYLYEHRDTGLEHNERLEFLGDAVLELIMTDYLYRKYPEKTEGELTSFRAALVNAVILSEVAQELSMNDYLLLSRGESKDVGRARQVILANTFEAVLGAIYLDQGYEAAHKFIDTYLFTRTEAIVAGNLWQDAKSYFQERSQETYGVTPVYQLISETGPDHNKKFVVGVFIGSEQVATGEGHSKREAEQEAAERGLKLKEWAQ